MSGDQIRTARQAWKLFKLPETAGADELRRAYRSAVRIAHPDHGGDAASLRAVVDAYRLLSELDKARKQLTPARMPVVRPRAPEPAQALHLEITAVEAVHGGRKSIKLPHGREVRIKLPPGLRSGDKLGLRTAAGRLVFSVSHAAGALEVRGNDLWMSVSVLSRVLLEGGQIEIDTPTGRKSVGVSAGAGLVGRVRLMGQGLPARGAHPQGHLFIRLVADAVMDKAAKETAARSALRRFTASWAAA